MTDSDQIAACTGCGCTYQDCSRYRTEGRCCCPDCRHVASPGPIPWPTREDLEYVAEVCSAFHVGRRVAKSVRAHLDDLAQAEQVKAERDDALDREQKLREALTRLADSWTVRFPGFTVWDDAADELKGILAATGPEVKS